MARADGGGDGHRARRGGAETRCKGEGGPSAGGYGALRARPKLIGPVEALVVGARASAPPRASHGLGRAEAHPAAEGRDGRGAGALFVLDGILVNRVRVGRETSTAQEGRWGRRRSAREAEGRDREPPARIVRGSGG